MVKICCVNCKLGFDSKPYHWIYMSPIEIRSERLRGNEEEIRLSPTVIQVTVTSVLAVGKFCSPRCLEEFKAKRKADEDANMKLLAENRRFQKRYEAKGFSRLADSEEISTAAGKPLAMKEVYAINMECPSCQGCAIRGTAEDKEKKTLQFTKCFDCGKIQFT
jgi:hypothetical protein